MKKIIRDAVILTVITLISGFCLGMVHDITAEPIKQAEEAKTNKAYKAVMPDADTFEEVKVEDFQKEGFEKQSILNVVTGKDSSGSEVGYVITVNSNQGYGGAIVMSVGISTKDPGVITGVDFLTMSESPGLGDNAKKPEFKDQYVNKKADAFTVVKETPSSDSEIKAITGATITSRAVTMGVNAAVAYYNDILVKEGASK